MTQFQKCSVMEPMEWIALIGGILSLIGIGVDTWQTSKANQRQEEHDEAMAALNHRYREEEAVSSFEREANFNQYANDAQKMLEANISPSLMYGGIQPSAPSVSSVGSSQGAGNVGRKMNVSDFLGKLDPAEYSSQAIDRINAKTMKERMLSQNQVDAQSIRESISRTTENQRNTAFKKSLESAIFKQEQEQLRQLRIQGEQMDFDLAYSRDTRDIRLEKEKLQNRELEKKIDLVSEQIKTEPVKRSQLAAEIRQCNAAVGNYNANTDLLQENLKNGVVGRVMKEMGLNWRKLPANFRAVDIEHGPWQAQMKAAKIALEEAGFSEYEATAAVLYYCAQDGKDVTPSVVNGVSRILSSFIGK